MKKKLSSYTVALILISTMLISSLTILPFYIGHAQSEMTFTSGEKIDFTSTTEMTFKSPEDMEFMSNVTMKFGSNITIQFIESSVIPDGILWQCDNITIIWSWPPGYVPEACSWWEVIDPTTGASLGEIHIDGQVGPYEVHVDAVYPGPGPGAIFFPAGGVLIGKKKIDIIEPCMYFEVHWPSHWWPEPCTWWEIIDPETGEFTGYEFHVSWTNESCEFHVDMVYPDVYIPAFPWYEIWARKKIPGIQPCDYFVVHDPLGWYPEPCTWWEIMDPYEGVPTGYEFHVDWTNESCEFHVDKLLPDAEIVFPWFPTVTLIAEKKVTNITSCDWFMIVDPPQFLPLECTWWEILDDSGAPTGLEFHVDATDGIILFHVDGTLPDIVITIPPSYTVTARKKIDIIQQCDEFKVGDPTTTPGVCTWWEVLDENGDATGWEFHVDANDNQTGWFHVDTVIPGPADLPPSHELTAEKKIDNIEPCDWFKVIDPPDFMPQFCSWWEVIYPQQWAGTVFHVDGNDGEKFHIDIVITPPDPFSPPPYNVTAVPTEPPPEPWYIKPPQPDYAPAGMPDIDQRQDNWGPGQGIFTWCGPTAVANSLWWLDSEYESIYNPTPVPPPTISDSFPLVQAYGAWDDHDPLNVNPFVLNLALLMDTDAQQSGDGHIGTRWTDMVTGIDQYLIQQGVEDVFEVHFQEFPWDFYWIEDEIERCQDVVLFLEFWYYDELYFEWVPLYDNPNLEYGHYVTCAGVNSTTIELLISDPIADQYEAGLVNGRSPYGHVYPHGTSVHNDTKYVSHDAYPVGTYMGPPPPLPYMLELLGYLQAMGYQDPNWHAFIRAAVVTSPTAVHDVAVIDVKPDAPLARNTPLGPSVKTV